jgi:hypothetical protein
MGDDISQIPKHLRDTHPVEELPELKWLDNFLPAVGAVAAFGGSITFTLIPSGLQEPKHTFTTDKVRLFLSLAWLFFFLALASAGMTSLVVAFQRNTIKDALERRKENKDLLGGLEGRVHFNERMSVRLICKWPISLVLQELVLAAFLVLGLAVAAYVPSVGWTAVALVAITMLGAFVIWLFQVL